MTILDLKVAFFCILVDELREPLVFETEKSKKIKKCAAMLESSTTEIIKNSMLKNNQINPQTSLLCLVINL